MFMKKAAMILSSLFLVGTLFLTASAQTTTDIPSYIITQEGCTIGEGETVSYTTISPQFAGQELPEGMYAGDLTVEITGQIVIERGGTFSIGTLSIGSDQEASPVISGDVSQAPLIIVKAGGTLKLTSVTLDTMGEGLLILQEPGSSISIIDTEIPEELVQWAPPTVDNLYDAPDDLWLEEGTPMDSSQLPSAILTNLQEQGQEERLELLVCWDMSSYDGRTTGEITLTGSFLDENGEAIPSMIPLTITVHWYQPDLLVVSDTKWTGENACSAHFTLLELPEYAEVTGEISVDGGKTWSIWPDFDMTEDSRGNVVCNFYNVENTPQYYRIVATDPYIPAFWISDSFLLPQQKVEEDDGDEDKQEEQDEDIGGNRGGSTTPVAPDREPTLPEPKPLEEPQPTPTPFAHIGNSVIGETTIKHDPQSTPTPESTPTPKPSATPSSTVSDQESPAPSQPAAASNTTQIILVIGGMVVCVVLAIWIARKRT